MELRGLGVESPPLEGGGVAQPEHSGGSGFDVGVGHGLQARNRESERQQVQPYPQVVPAAECAEKSEGEAQGDFEDRRSETSEDELAHAVEQGGPAAPARRGGMERPPAEYLENLQDHMAGRHSQAHGRGEAAPVGQQPRQYRIPVHQEVERGVHALEQHEQPVEPLAPLFRLGMVPQRDRQLDEAMVGWNEAAFWPVHPGPGEVRVVEGAQAQGRMDARVNLNMFGENDPFAQDVQGPPQGVGEAKEQDEDDDQLVQEMGVVECQQPPVFNANAAIRWVPRTMRSEWRQTVWARMQGIISAFDADNSIRLEAEWIRLLTLTRLLPQVPSRGGKNSRKKRIRERLDTIQSLNAALQPEWVVPTVERAQFEQRLELLGQQGFFVPPSAEIRANRAMYQVRHGQWAKAVRALAETGVVRPNAETLDKLRAKFTDQEQQPATLPRCPEESDMSDEEKRAWQPPQVTVDDLKMILKRLPTGNATGVSAWAYEHIVDFREDDEILAAITIIINNVLKGRCVDGLAPLMTTRLIAVPKPDSDDVRPINIGDVWLRLIQRCAAMATKARVFEAVKGFQYGIHSPGGMESIVWLTRFQMEEDEVNQEQDSIDDDEEGPGPSGAAVGMVDLTNAYGSIDRTELFVALAKHCPSLLPFANAEYHTGIQGIYFLDADHVVNVPATKGVLQGDACAPIFFSVYLHELLLQLTSKAEWPAVTVLAYLDDVTFLGTPQAVVEAISQFRVAAEQHHLVVNMRKSMVFCPHFPDDVNLPDGLRVVQEGCKLLGIPIGSEPFVRQECLQWLQQQRTAIHSLHLLPVHTRIDILRCCMIPRIVFRLRNLPMKIAHDIAQSFNQVVQDFVVCAMDMQHLSPSRYPKDAIPEEVWREIQLPAGGVCGGPGMGIRNMDVAVEPGLIASWQNVCEAWRQRDREQWIKEVMESATEMAQSLHSVWFGFRNSPVAVAYTAPQWVTCVLDHPAHEDIQARRNQARNLYGEHVDPDHMLVRGIMNRTEVDLWRPPLQQVQGGDPRRQHDGAQTSCLQFDFLRQQFIDFVVRLTDAWTADRGDHVLGGMRTRTGVERRLKDYAIKVARALKLMPFIEVSRQVVVDPGGDIVIPRILHWPMLLASLDLCKGGTGRLQQLLTSERERMAIWSVWQYHFDQGINNIHHATRIMSLCSRGSSAWLWPARYPQLRLSDSDYLMSFRWRFGLPLVSDLAVLPPTCLLCGQQLREQDRLRLDAALHHAFHCHAMANARIWTHNDLVRELRRYCLRFYPYVIMEPAAPLQGPVDGNQPLPDPMVIPQAREPHLRADLRLGDTNGKYRDLDVTVVTPLATRRLPHAIADPLFAASAASASKRRKFAPRYVRSRIVFDPVSFQVFGGVCPDTGRFLSQLAIDIARTTKRSSSVVSQELNQCLSVTLQRANVRLFRHFLSRTIGRAQRRDLENDLGRRGRRNVAPNEQRIGGRAGYFNGLE